MHLYTLVPIRVRRCAMSGDSGSTQSFLNLSLLDKFTGVSTTEPIPVKIADGALLHCTSQIADYDWTSNGCTFRSNFRFLPLGAYDGIIGMDWLTQHSPMEVDWGEDHIG